MRDLQVSKFTKGGGSLFCLKLLAQLPSGQVRHEPMLSALTTSKAQIGAMRNEVG